MLSTVRVAFLGGEQLVLNKVAAGRPKDIADLALLSEIGLRPPRKRRRRQGGPHGHHCSIWKRRWEPNAFNASTVDPGALAKTAPPAAARAVLAKSDPL